jgi:hypothetical protein
MKQARVSVIKDNIEKLAPLPEVRNDCDVGQWVDAEMMRKGHTIDSKGRVDMPEYNIDNKTRKKGSNANHTVGSMTISDIIATPVWEETGFYPKVQNQNQVTWDPVFREVADVKIVDMALPEIQSKLKDAYEDLRRQLVAGVRTKTITSSNRWAVFDGFNHPNSYRYRITNTAMKQILIISSMRDSLKLFDFE